MDNNANNNVEQNIEYDDYVSLHTHSYYSL